MKVRSLFTNKVIYIFVLITCFLEWNIEVVKSEESGANKLCEVVPEANTYEIITQNTISQTELTIPSLWWRKQQLDPKGEIIINWQAYKKDRIIDLIVIGQRWNSLDYIKRYSIVNDFGTLAREYQYYLRIISERQVCLATYSCQFDFSPDRCQIDFEFLGRSILEKGN